MAITSTLTPFDNFSGHSKVRFGVGEQVKLDIKEVPPVNPATPVAWVIKSGPASVHNDPKSPGRGTLECGNRAGAVVLELRNTKTKDLVDTKRFQVVEPSEARFSIKVLNIAHGAGFLGAINLFPQDVSFKWVEMREGGANYEGKGCFAKKPVEKAELATNYAVIHPVMGGWVGCFGGAKKNLIKGQDTVSTAISNYGTGGEFSWHIPWFFRVHGVSGETKFMDAVHHCVIDRTGKMTLTKLNGRVSAQL